MCNISYKPFKRSILPFIIYFFYMGLPLNINIAYSYSLDDAYSYLNKIRESVNMIPLKRNQFLETSAQNHADYLALNQIDGHDEESGRPNFTGCTPSNRAAYAGYPSLYVMENVSSGNPDFKDSIDSLMSAIYHRIGFLGFTIDEVGIGRASSNRDYYVYNMGNSLLASLCSEDTSTTYSYYYTGVCSDESKEVDGGKYDNASKTLSLKNPPIIKWPPPDASDIDPVFYEEYPDPLPDYSVSGYPVSIQFNEAVYSWVRLKSFKLIELSGEGAKEVAPVRLFDTSSDPNGRLSPLEFALFPLSRLKWDTQYRVDAQYEAGLIEGGAETEGLKWEFRTKALDAPIITILRDHVNIKIPQGIKKFFLYFPPQKDAPFFSEINYSYLGNEPTIEFEDMNTLSVVLISSLGDEIELLTSDGHIVSMDIVSEDGVIEGDGVYIQGIGDDNIRHEETAGIDEPDANIDTDKDADTSYKGIDDIYSIIPTYNPETNIFYIPCAIIGNDPNPYWIELVPQIDETGRLYLELLNMGKK